MKHRFVRRYEDFWNRRRLDIVQGIGNMQRHPVIDPRDLGVSAPANHTHDAVAELEPFSFRSDSDYFAGDFQPHDLRVAEVDAAVATPPVREISAIDGCRMIAHKQIMAAQLWLRNINEF